MSEFRDNSGELVVSRLLTSKLGIQRQRGNKKVSTSCLHVCKNNVYNSEQWVVNIVHEMSNVIAASKVIDQNQR